MMRNFIYFQPHDLQEASRQLVKGWQRALPLAGGTDLLGLMKDEIETPEVVVNLKSLAGLDRLKYTRERGLEIGALVSIAAIADHPEIRRRYPALGEAALEIGSPQLRNMGTVGGNLCQRPRCWYFRGEFHCLRKGGDLCYAVDGQNKYHCIIGGGPCYIVHPSDLAVAFLALNTQVMIYSRGKIKQIPLAEFFVLPDQDVFRENRLHPGDLLLELRVPDIDENARNGFIKFKERGAWDFSVVSVAGLLERNGSQFKKGRVVFGGVAPIPWLEQTVSEKLSGLPATSKALSELADLALQNAEPLASNGYKLPLARNLLKKLLRTLTA